MTDRQTPQHINCFNIIVIDNALQPMFQGMRQRFVAAVREANNITELDMDAFWSNLAVAMNMSTELFKRGVANPQQGQFHSS